MDRYLKSSLKWLTCAALIALWWMLYGCAGSQATVARTDGFNAQWRGFSAVPATPELYREATITLKVIIVGDMAKIGYPGAAGTYSHPQGVIRIVGKQTPYGILLPSAVIGHEVEHALQFQAEGFLNPDRLTEYGY